MAQIRLVVNTDLKQAKAAVDTLKTSFADLAKQLSTITVNKNLTAQLNALTKYYDSVANAGARAAQQTRGTAANVETLRKSYSNLLAQIKRLKNQYEEGIFESARTSVESNIKSLDELSKITKSNKKLNDDQIKDLQRLSKEYREVAADVAQLKAEKTNLQVADKFATTTADNVSRLQKRFQSLLLTIKSAEKYYPKGTFDSLKTDIQGSVAELKGLDLASKEALPTLNRLNSSALKYDATLKELQQTSTNYHGTLRDIIQGFIKFQLSASIVMNSIQLIRSAFNSLNETLVETEKVVVSIQRVLDETVEGGEIADKLYDIAERLGQSFDNVQEIAQNFAKAGLSWQETLEATEAAVLALNVAELTATESSEGLIAVMQQFNYEASELTYVIDVLNKAADKSAVDTPALLVALQKTGSYAAAANLSLEQTVGLISALSEATAASGQNIGNALKSLFSYTTRDSSLDTFASLSDDMNEVVEQYRLGAKSILDVWEQLSVEMQSLDAQQADALSQWTESSGLDAELEGELSEIYDSLTGVYDSAGVYRKNYFIALMNNFDEVKDVMGEISDAAGYTAEEQAKYMNTYEAKLNSLQAQWQHLANDEQGWLAFRKGLLDIGNGILQLIEFTGGLRTTVLALLSVLLIVFGDKIISGIKNFGNAIKGLVTGFKSATTAARGFQAALGWIGIASTALSLFVGIFSAIEQSSEEAEQKVSETLSAGADVLTKYSDAIDEVTQSYEEYSRRIQELKSILLDEASTTEEVADAKQELLDIQNEFADSHYADSIDIVNGKLEDQLAVLEKINEETLRQNVSEYLDENADAIYNARKYLTDTFSEITFDEAHGLWSSPKELLNWLKERGYDTREQTSFGDAFDTFFTNSEKIYTQIKTDSMTRGEQIEFLENLFELAGQEENKELAEYLQAQIRSAIKEIEESEDYQNALDIIYGDKSASGIASLPIETLQKYNEGLITTEEFLSLIRGEVEGTTDSIKEQIDKFEELNGDALDKFIDGYKELRDLQKESLDLEEKKQAVLEAEQALEDAKNSRGKYVLNAETGQFEWREDQKSIKEAEDNLNSAIESLQESVDTAIISELESGNATNESILAILTGIASTIDNEGLHEYLNQFLNYAKEQGIDLGDVSFDSGGIASGLGFLPKATSRPESVNDPALTAKILSPTSNAQFDRYVRDMGIMFEQARTYTQAPVLQSTAGNNVVTTTNNSTYINGVKIGSDMMSKPFGEVLQMVSMVPTK